MVARAPCGFPEEDHFPLELLRVRKGVGNPALDLFVLESETTADEAVLLEIFLEVVALDQTTRLFWVEVELKAQLPHSRREEFEEFFFQITAAHGITLVKNLHPLLTSVSGICRSSGKVTPAYLPQLYTLLTCLSRTFCIMLENGLNYKDLEPRALGMTLHATKHSESEPFSH